MLRTEEPPRRGGWRGAAAVLPLALALAAAGALAFALHSNSDSTDAGGHDSVAFKDAQPGYFCFCSSELPVEVGLSAAALLVLVLVAYGGMPAWTALEFLIYASGPLADIAYLALQEFFYEWLKWVALAFVVLHFFLLLVVLPPHWKTFALGIAAVPFWRREHARTKHVKLPFWNAPPKDGRYFRMLIKSELANSVLVVALVNALYTGGWWLVWGIVNFFIGLGLVLANLPLVLLFLLVNTGVLLVRTVLWPAVFLLFFMLGGSLFATKLLAIPRVGIPFLSVWRTGTFKTDSTAGVVMRTFNQTLLLSCCLVTVPQLVFILLNSVEGSRWTTVAVVTFAVDVLVLMSTIWNFVYFSLFSKWSPWEMLVFGVARDAKGGPVVEEPNATVAEIYGDVLKHVPGGSGSEPHATTASHEAIPMSASNEVLHPTLSVTEHSPGGSHGEHPAVASGGAVVDVSEDDQSPETSHLEDPSKRKASTIPAKSVPLKSSKKNGSGRVSGTTPSRSGSKGR